MSNSDINHILEDLEDLNNLSKHKYELFQIKLRKGKRLLNFYQIMSDRRLPITAILTLRQIHLTVHSLIDFLKTEKDIPYESLIV
jgi:hypothetical protein